jgi:hypothetical protein
MTRAKFFLSLVHDARVNIMDAAMRADIGIALIALSGFTDRDSPTANTEEASP